MSFLMLLMRRMEPNVLLEQKYERNIFIKNQKQKVGL